MPAPAGRRLVGLALPPGAEFTAALEAAWQRGDAVLPLDPAARAPATSVLAAMQPDDPVADGVALVIATSGSTGRPKGVQLSHAALDASIRAAHARIGVQPDDVWLSCLPWHHIGGLQVMLRARQLGIPLIVHERFDVARVAVAAATLVSLVPTQFGRLLEAGVDLKRFRVVLLGGAPAAPALLQRAAAAGVRVVTTYGMSETAGGCVYDGRPLDGVEVAVGEDGRIRLRGPMLMAGYRGQPQLTAEVLIDGWLVTNDIGRYAEGRLQVIGRVDDVVITGGENVATADVGAVLAEHPGLADIAVTGVDDPDWGQRLVAVAVPVIPEAPPSLDELREWCTGRLSRAATPRELIIVGAIPRLASGKPDRLAVARLAAGAPAAQGRPSAR